MGIVIVGLITGFIVLALVGIIENHERRRIGKMTFSEFIKYREERGL